jgi:acyl-CoA thioesterase-1
MTLDVRKLCFFAMIAGLCACQNQNSPPRSAPKSAALPVREPSTGEPGPDGRPVIVCFGDSLTAGYGLETSQSYPAVLQRELDRSGYRYRVVNSGVSGETTQDGLARVAMVVAEKPAVVILEFGANDGLRGVPVPAMESNLAKMIESLQAAHTQVLLAGMTLPPNYGPDYIRRFETAFRNVAAKYHVKLMPFFLQGVAGNSQFLLQDGLHPNAEGTRRVAGQVFDALKPLLKKE